MTDQQTGQPTTADIATGIRTELATIRRHWDATLNPPTSRGNGGSLAGPAGSKLPGNDTAISLRAEVTRDLAFWVDQVIRTHPLAHAELLAEWRTLDAGDVERTCRFLAQHADTIASWESALRLWDELVTLAREVKALACPPVRDTVPIGDCPTCGTAVRARIHGDGPIKCRLCGTVDTLEGWVGRIVGVEPLVTATELVPILHRRMGLVVTRSTISSWLRREIIAAADRDSAGRALFDRRQVFAAITRWEARRDSPEGVDTTSAVG